MPRRAGTAASPSPLRLAPATPSSTSVSCNGLRWLRSPFPTSVRAVAGGSSRSAVSPSTVTDSSRPALTVRTSSPEAGSDSTFRGRIATPSARVTTISNGGRGLGSRRKRPSPSASAVPRPPSTCTRAPISAWPSFVTRRPSKPTALPAAAMTIATTHSTFRIIPPHSTDCAAPGPRTACPVRRNHQDRSEMWHRQPATSVMRGDDAPPAIPGRGADEAPAGSPTETVPPGHPCPAGAGGCPYSLCGVSSGV